ncbi:MAG: molybdopterin-dependent oxidoreductase [Alphaproteobacteria bacterium]|nr:molybdopterin-dependent oxidoreductase [Alphaproteobacteria bacterium]MCB9791562.1 molybdopterin-dependent oxidoreductase [Alphaproteobacteria bacterium]
MPWTTRRGFLRGSLLGAAALSTADAAAPGEALAASEEAMPAEAGEAEVSFSVNGQAHTFTVDADEVALDTVRERLGLTGCKRGCGHGACGACAVLVDGVPEASCLLPTTALQGSEVTTIEAIGAQGLHPVQKAFMAHDGLQCGFCTPGFIVEATAFYDRWRAERGTEEPDRDAIADALSGHLCRCGAYQGIYSAVAAACRGDFDAVEVVAPRHEAADKVTGKAQYTVDVSLPGMLHGAVLHSPHAHAKLVSLNFDEALALPGVKAAVAVTAPGTTLRYVGMPVAAVAAVDAHTAEMALAFIDAQYEVRAPLVGPEAALAEGAAPVYASDKVIKAEAPNAAEGAALGAKTHGNLRGPAGIGLGKPRKVEKRLAEAEAAGRAVSGSWSMQTQAHTTLEPHACVARWTDDGGLETWISSQSVHWTAQELAELYELPFAKVRVIARHVGAGFGSKAGVQPETPICIDLAREAGAPVKLAFTREAELTMAGLRPGAKVDIQLGMAEDGSLGGLHAQAYSNGGCSLGSTVASMMHFIYASDYKKLEDYDVLSHGPGGKPFRGPSGPASTWALEGALEELAAKTGKDSLSIRQAWDVNEGRLRLYETVAKLPMWTQRRTGPPDTGRYRRGVGMATGAWLPFVQPTVEVRMSASTEGFELVTACQDMGNGVRTVMAVAAAEVLGIGPEQLRIDLGDSASPTGCMCGGSRATPSMGPAAAHAAAQLREALVDAAEQRLGLADASPGEGGVKHSGGFVTWAEILEAGPPVSVTARRPKDPGGYFLPFAIADIKIFKLPPGAVQLTEVEVDTRLGRVRATKTWSGVSVGRIYSKPLASSQVFGGVVQGISYALYEERRLCPSTGVTLTSNLEDYRIMGIGDAPEMEVFFDETPRDGVLGGGIGLSEAVTIPVAASVASAVAHATGWRPHHSPIRPERVLEALS